MKNINKTKENKASDISKEEAEILKRYLQKIHSNVILNEDNAESESCLKEKNLYKQY